MERKRERERRESDAPEPKGLKIVRGRRKEGREEEGKPYDVLVVSLNAASYNATT